MNITFVYYGRYQVREPVELEYCSAIVKQEGHSVALAYDPGVFGITDNVWYSPFLARLLSGKSRVIREIKESLPDVVIFSVYLNSYQWALDVAAAVKKSLPAPVVFIGLHAALAPEAIMSNASVDYVIQGETEGIILKFLKMIRGSMLPSGVENLWYRNDKDILHNALLAPVDLDALPLPDKSLFRGYIDFKDSYMIMASRGCHYECSFCEETALRALYKKNLYRKRSAASVMHELIEMKKRYNFKEVIFKDNFFTHDIAWIKEFLTEYRTHIKAPFKCFGKIQYFNEEIALMLKESGCYCVEFGLQTWNENLRKRILNRFETDEQARRVFRICDRFRLRYDIDHMFGLPEEALSDHIHAAREYARLKYLNRVKCHNLVYLPNSRIVFSAEECGLIPPDYAERLPRGAETDFFNTSREKKEMKAVNQCFRNFFKLITLFPETTVSFIVRTKLYVIFRFIPGCMIIMGQLLAALRGRDVRFSVYIKQYPKKIIRSFKIIA